MAPHLPARAPDGPPPPGAVADALPPPWTASWSLALDDDPDQPVFGAQGRAAHIRKALVFGADVRVVQRLGCRVKDVLSRLVR